MSSPATSGFASDILSFIEQLDEEDRVASSLVADLNDMQANWQPGSGSEWSVAQCLDHMAVTSRTYLAALKTAATRARAGHRPLQAAGWVSRYFLSKAEPPATLKIKAPKKVQPASNIAKSEALARFMQSTDEVRRFAIETAGLDLCGVRFKNPFVPLLNFTVATGMLVITAHHRRHLWQAREVLKQPDFPR
jgi:hypothetical protein